MLFCLLESSCEPKPDEIHLRHRCCNSCKNKSCENRCNDLHDSCRLAADKQWIDYLESNSPFTVKEADKAKPVNSSESKDLGISKVSETVLSKSKEELKKEARRRRREARKRVLSGLQESK